jgi:ribosomal-protein-alanine N-acetyltransferase
MPVEAGHMIHAPVVLKTSRLVLRKFRPGDLDELCSLYADRDVRRYFPGGTLSRQQTQDELGWHLRENLADPEIGLWAAIHRPTGRFIGRCGLIPWTIGRQPEVELAYLLSKEFWRRGLGSEIAAALVRHGFVRLRLERLIALIDPMNLASIRTAEKVGFAFERELELAGNKVRLYAAEAAH